MWFGQYCTWLHKASHFRFFFPVWNWLSGQICCFGFWKKDTHKRKKRSSFVSKFWDEFTPTANWRISHSLRVDARIRTNVALVMLLFESEFLLKKSMKVLIVTIVPWKLILHLENLLDLRCKQMLRKMFYFQGRQSCLGGCCWLCQGPFPFCIPAERPPSLTHRTPDRLYTNTYIVFTTLPAETPPNGLLPEFPGWSWPLYLHCQNNAAFFLLTVVLWEKQTNKKQTNKPKRHDVYIAASAELWLQNFNFLGFTPTSQFRSTWQVNKRNNMYCTVKGSEENRFVSDAASGKCLWALSPQNDTKDCAAQKNETELQFMFLHWWWTFRSKWGEELWCSCPL